MIVQSVFPARGDGGFPSSGIFRCQNIRHEPADGWHRSPNTLHRSADRLHKSADGLHNSKNTLHRSEIALHKSVDTLHRLANRRHRSAAGLHGTPAPAHSPQTRPILNPRPAAQKAEPCRKDDSARAGGLTAPTGVGSRLAGQESLQPGLLLARSNLILITWFLSYPAICDSINWRRS